MSAYHGVECLAKTVAHQEIQESGALHLQRLASGSSDLPLNFLIPSYPGFLGQIPVAVESNGSALASFFFSKYLSVAWSEKTTTLLPTK
jgi:hypothetical protein